MFKVHWSLNDFLNFHVEINWVNKFQTPTKLKENFSSIVFLFFFFSRGLTVDYNKQLAGCYPLINPHFHCCLGGVKTTCCGELQPWARHSYWNMMVAAGDSILCWLQSLHVGWEQVGVPGKVPPGMPATAQLLSECAGILEEIVLFSAAESSSWPQSVRSSIYVLKILSGWEIRLWAENWIIIQLGFQSIF